MGKKFVKTGQFIYKHIARPVIFQLNSELMHESLTNAGEFMGRTGLSTILQKLTVEPNAMLKQKILEIDFDSPIGMAAGFDYDAKLTQVNAALGFGFTTVGTITAHPYGGNPSPMLVRLPKSKSLMVNKGFKNVGIEKIVNKLASYQFPIPTGISIGNTNTLTHQKQSDGIADIVRSFTYLAQSDLAFSYYELNISCPNLKSKVSFYSPASLKELLDSVDKLKLKKSIFIKMPISLANSQILKLLGVIAKSKCRGVIFGNLQKDRNNPYLDKDEKNLYKVGNFSGLPTQERSNELISLSYKNFKKDLVIVGCGGVFSPADAYEKIKRGASLVQLITGLVFEGPLLAACINYDLLDLLKADRFKNVSDAIGAKL